MDLSHVAANVRRIRAAKRRSQAELAEAAGLSRVGYRNVEAGTAVPRVDTLMKIAAALQVRLGELFEMPTELDHVRFRADKRMNSREDLLQHVARWLTAYNDLEQRLGMGMVFGLDDARNDVPRKARGDELAARMAAAVRRRLKLEDDALVRDIAGLLEDSGVKVYEFTLASPHFFGLSVAAKSGGPAVIVNVWDRISVERRIFTAAHELGHLLLHPGAYDVSKSDEVEAEEREANVFASHLLMPEATFRKEWEEARGLPFVDRVLKLKTMFRVSWQSVVYRYAVEMPREQRSALFERFRSDYHEKTGRTIARTEEPDGLAAKAFREGASTLGLAADEPEQASRFGLHSDRLLRLVRLGIEREEISLGRGAEILDLKLSEMRALANAWVE